MKNTNTIKITLEGTANRPKEKITPKESRTQKKDKIPNIMSAEKFKKLFKTNIFKK